MGASWILAGFWVQGRRLDCQSPKVTFGPQPPFGQGEVHWDFTDATLGLVCRAQGARLSALERRCLTRLETGLAAAG
jgi:hypothetical protein